MNENIIKFDEVEIDKRKVELLLRKIIIKEKNNIKTKQFNDSDMIKIIKKMIEEEVQCY